VAVETPIDPVSVEIGQNFRTDGPFAMNTELVGISQISKGKIDEPGKKKNLI